MMDAFSVLKMIRVNGMDLRYSERGAVVSGDAVWIGWRMYGTRTNGTLFEFTG